MSPYRRNLLVGVTVLAGLVMLGWMVLRFSGRAASWFTEERIPVQFVVSRAEGLAAGSPVLYRGVNVGQVTDVRRQDLKTIRVTATVEKEPPLPENVVGVIRAQSLLGAGAAISLEVAAGEEPRGALQPDAQLTARFAGLEILPPEFAELAGELTATARQFRESRIIEHLDGTVGRANQMLDSVQTLVDDPKLRENIQQTLENLRVASQSATKIAADLEKFSGNINEISVETSDTIKQARTTIRSAQTNIDDVSKQLAARLEQTSKLLDNFHSISNKIDKGEGTAGLLVNDPKLYEALVDTARELNATVSDMKRLVEQWEQEGVSLKLR